MIETAEALTRFEELVQTVAAAIDKGIRGSGDAQKIAQACVKTIEYESRRSENAKLRSAVKTTSFKAIQFALAAMSAILTSPQDPVQQTKNLAEAMKIAQSTRLTRAEIEMSEMTRTFEEARSGFQAEFHKGIESLTTELREKYGVTVTEGPGQWRAWRIFLGNLFELSQAERVKNVVSLAPTPSAEKDFWQDIANMTLLTDDEALDLDDLKNQRSPLNTDEQRAAEQTMNQILSTKSFEDLKRIVGDRYGAMHLVELGILNSQTPPELQNAALDALNALGRTDFLDKFKLA